LAVALGAAAAAAAGSVWLERALFLSSLPPLLGRVSRAASRDRPCTATVTLLPPLVVVPAACELAVVGVVVEVVAVAIEREAFPSKAAVHERARGLVALVATPIPCIAALAPLPLFSFPSPFADNV